MFFHTKRELDVAKIFGITNKFGLKLINQKHPFPYLVEQEERYHGAIISHTTYGGVFRVFDSLEYTESAENINQDFEYPGFIPETSKNIYNLCRAIRRKVIDNSLQVHEAFAKYIAFSRQVIEIKSWPNSLKELMDSECRKYPTLKSLVEILGVPDCTNSETNQFQISIGYILAKWILTTDELDWLYNKEDIHEFKSFFMGEYPLRKTSIESRSASAIKFLEDNITSIRLIYNSYDKNSNDGDLEENNQYWGSHLKAIYNFIGEQLKTEGHIHLPLQSAKEIFIKVIVITSKIQMLSKYIHTVLKKDCVEIWITGSRVTGKLLETVGSLPSILSADLSFRVSYDQLYNENFKWKFIQNHGDIIEDFGNHNFDNLFIYPSINKNKELECFLTLQLNLGLDEKNDKHIAIRNYVFIKKTLKELFNLISNIRSKNKIIVLLPFQFDGLEEYRTTARLLSKFGNVVIWTHNSDFFNIYLIPVKQFFLGTQKFLYEAQKVLGIPSYQPYMHVTIDSDFSFFSSAPNYFANSLWRLKATNIDNSYISDASEKIVFQVPNTDDFRYLNGGSLELTDNQRRILTSAVRAYEIIYEYPTLPTYLPLYDSAEMFNYIKTLSNE